MSNAPDASAKIQNEFYISQATEIKQWGVDPAKNTIFFGDPIKSDEDWFFAKQDVGVIEGGIAAIRLREAVENKHKDTLDTLGMYFCGFLVHVDSIKTIPGVFQSSVDDLIKEFNIEEIKRKNPSLFTSSGASSQNPTTATVGASAGSGP